MISIEIRSITINCVCKSANFNAIIKQTVYSCFISNLNISSVAVVTDVTRNQTFLSGNVDVKLLAVHNQTVAVLPEKLGIFFVNVEGFEIISSGLKMIGKKNLKDFASLKYLNLMKNKLECLPENLFERNSMLEILIVCCNNLKVIHSSVFDTPRLIYIDFRRNVCVSSKAEGTDELLRLSREVDSKCPPSIEVYCTYEDRDFAAGNYYTCSVRFWIVVIDFMTVSDFQGRQADKSLRNCHVKGLIVDEMTTKFLPTNLAQHFPKLSAIEVIGGRLSRLEQKDLKPFPHLKVLWLPRNNLESLSSDVFEANLKLEKISFYENRIKFIANGVLNPLKHLQYANFELNECIDSFASTKVCIKSLEIKMHDKCLRKKES